MKKLLERITRRRAENQTKDAAPQETPDDGLPTEPEPGGTMEAAPKPPPELPLFFMLSHLDDDGPVRLDGVKLGVCEVMGLELDEPKLGAFAGALNAPGLPGAAAHPSAPAAPGQPEREPSTGATGGTCPRRRKRPAIPSRGC